MTRLVAIDGGQSALRLKLLPDGAVGTGPGYVHSPDPVGMMIDAVRRAADAVALEPGVDVVCLGLTGYPENNPYLVSELAAAVAKLLGATEVRLTGDMVTAHAGALPEGYGVVVAAGTGVVCLALDRDGSWHKVDGLGYVFGDDGGSFWIGRAGVSAVLRAAEGRGPATALTDALGAIDLGGLYRSPTMVDDVARYAPAVLSCAAGGDPTAQDILTRAAAALAATIATGVGFLDGEVPVACAGGLFAAGELLLGPIREALPARAELRVSAGSPLDGAARLATGDPGPYRRLLHIHRTPTGDSP